jgi:hypothetical protein
MSKLIWHNDLDTLTGGDTGHFSGIPAVDFQTFKLNT